jgi:hypothetical protein
MLTESSFHWPRTECQINRLAGDRSRNRGKNGLTIFRI